MSNTLVFRVSGNPQGKGRHRTANINGRMVAYTPKKTRSYEREIADAAKNAAMIQGWTKCDMPVGVNVCAWFAIPQSWSKKKQDQARLGLIFPTVKPDADNLIKAVADGMNSIAYNDDRQIVNLHIQKRYCRENEEPNIVVVVSKIQL